MDSFSLFSPLGLLGLLALGGIVLFALLDRGHAKYYLETPLDRLIPFRPAFIIPYLSFLLLVPASFAVLFVTPVAAAFYTALVIGSLAGSLARYLIRAGIRQPRIRRHDLSDRLVRFVYRHDDRAHTFPSVHVLVTTVMAYFVSAAFPAWAILIWAWGILVIVSTLFVKQHYLIDVFGGIAFAAAAIYIAHAIVLVA